MKISKKRILMFLIIAIIIILLFIVIINNKKEDEKNDIEYQPEEEISVSQERKTIVSLYFKNKKTKELEPEARLIDVKTLVEDPYNTIINLLLDGSKKENLEKTIPEGTKVNDIKLKEDTLIIDFSSEFIENNNEEIEDKEIIDSIVKTFTELTEVDSIKILINGEENKEFKDGKLNFSNIFIREE